MDKRVFLEICGGEDFDGGEMVESFLEIFVRSQFEVFVVVVEVIRGDGFGVVCEGLVVVGEVFFDGFWGREDENGMVFEFEEENRVVD